ncbi:MAG: WbqC family protein [Bacteroidetes bacterium]|nr:WbqC family protein [Bacteroidota bacterium]
MGENFQINQINQLPSACFPSLKYLQHCGAEKHFFIESKETYPKQTLRNRYLVNGANSPILLTIPVRKPNGSKTITEDIEIDCSTNWQKVHIETLKTAYNNSPYFEHYLYELNHFFDFKNSKLIDWNNRVLAWLNNH